jgi:hypothetical protein
MSHRFPAHEATVAIDSEMPGLGRELLELETRLINIQYLLTLPELTEVQKQQLRPFFLAAIAELIKYCDIVDPRLLA